VREITDQVKHTCKQRICTNEKENREHTKKLDGTNRRDSILPLIFGLTVHMEAHETKEQRIPMYKVPHIDVKHSYKDNGLVNDNVVVLIQGTLKPETS
jgi:hypothetical protein